MQCVLACLTYFGLMWALPSLRGLYLEGMECNRPEQVTLGPGKMAGTRSHTLPTPGGHLPKANPAL